MDVDTDSVTATIAVGNSPVQVAVDAAGRHAYVSLGEDSSVAKVDLSSKKVIETVSVPSSPVQLYLSQDGARLLSANQGTEDDPGDTVSVIDPDSMRIEATITTGQGPHGIVIDPSGRRAWVTNMYQDTVSVLDLEENTVEATVAVGDRPNGISYSPAQGTGAPITTRVEVSDNAEVTGTPEDHEDSGHDH